MGQSMLQRVNLSEKEIKRRFLAYLNQRGVVNLMAFCTALNLPVPLGRTNKKNYHFAHKLDALVTPLLPCPECRVEEGQGTSHWEVRYYAKPPKPPSFAPRPQGQVTAWVDPHLKGSWRREVAQAAEAEMRAAKNAAFAEEAQRQRQEAREWAKAVVPVANSEDPEPSPTAPEPSPPSPLSQGGEGGQEPEIPPAPLGKGGMKTTTTTENKAMAKRRKAEARTMKDCRQLIADMRTAIAELEEEVASLGALEADLRDDYERQIRELQERLRGAG